MDNLSQLPKTGRISDLCRVMGWSAAIAAHYCRIGEVPGAFKIGRRWYIPQATIVQFSAGAVRSE